MKPTPAQQLAIESIAPITFAIAGPGSGKTRTLIWRILHLIESGVAPAHIACITFTNAAAREIERRIASAECPIPASNPGFCTPPITACDGNCQDRAYYKPPVLGYIGTLHGFMLKLLRSLGALVGWGGGRITVLDEEETDHLIKECCEEQAWKGTDKEVMEAIARGPLTSTQFTKAELVAAAFWQKLRRRKAITFDGLLLVGKMILANGDPASFSHYLIDEVQDSSDLDFEIYRRLVGTIWYAGDPDQSIYAFRGARVAHCLALSKLDNCAVIALEDNFRSGVSICSTAQRLIEHNKNRWQKTTRSAVTFSDAVSIQRYDSPTIEAMSIGQMIASHSDLSHAVLLRTNALVQEYANHLRAMSIPVAESKQVVRPPDWLRLMADLAFMDNPNDDHACYRWLELKNGKMFADAARQKAMMAFTSIHRQLAGIETWPVEDVVGFLCKDGLSDSTVAMVAEALQRMPSNRTIGDLIIELSRQETVEEGTGVTVTTLHGAKGREWDVVFLPAMEQHICPGKRANLDVEEERRLAYVGVTRARQRLFLSHCERRVIPWSGTSQPQAVEPSQFLAEMGFGI